MPRPPRTIRPGPFAYHETVELTIETLTNQGQGLARVPVPDAQGGTGRWVVMVPFALPGERVKARIFRNQKNFSEADLVEVLEPSPDRVEPPCPLFGTCGGCQYQQLAYSAQLAWKRRQVQELLRHMAGVEFEVAPVVGSPVGYGYRAKLTPHFDKPRGTDVGNIGFLRAGTRWDMLDVPQCPIATSAINARLAELRADILAHPGRHDNGATLLLREDADGGVHTDATDEMESAVGPLRFRHFAGDFFQNNPFILPAFVAAIVEQAAASGAHWLVDAYCGSGLFALSAASRFRGVAGVEISPSAVRQATANAERNGITNATFLAASAEAIFEGIAFPAAESVVIIDPPRAGCSEAFLHQLVTWRPSCCVYVSCNPATQMRDLKTFLAAGYTLEAVQPFDLFPQTKHLECVITLRAAASPTA